MKFTACMLVSRDDALMTKAFQSILKQEPDEIRIYLDPVKLGDTLHEVKEYLESHGAKTFIQDVSQFLSVISSFIASAIFLAVWFILTLVFLMVALFLLHLRTEISR